MKNLIAPEGKVYQSKIDERIYARQLFLGCNDSVKNYELVDESSIKKDDEEPPNGGGVNAHPGL